MGRAITYCFQCSKRVSDADLDTGKAYRVGDRIFCRDCAPESAKIQTTKKVQRPKEFSTSVTLKTQPKPAEPAPPPGTAPAAGRRRTLLLAGAVGAAAVLVVIVVVLMSRGGAPPPPPPSVDDPTPVSKEPATPRDAKEAAAKADLEKARAFAKAHPDEPDACRKAFDDLVWRWEGTDAAAEAAKEATAIKTAAFDRVKGWMAEANRDAQELVDKGELRAAAAKIEKLKSAHPLVEWRLAVEARVSELLVEAVKADDRKKAEAEKAAEALEKSVEKGASEEAKGYPPKWEAAIGRATGRDFAGAESELQRVVASLKDEGVRAEAAQDLKDLQGLAALFKSSLDALKKKPRGVPVWLQARQAGGETKRISGLILQIDAQRVEVLQPKGSALVDWEDVASSTFARGAAAGTADPRLLPELCLLDGEVEAARAYDAELTPKWWAYAEKARAKLPKPDPSERAARDAFAAAEAAFRSADTRAAAIDQYRALRTDYASSSIVKTYAERIARRLEAGKEYYFAPADFRVEGSFRLSKAGKLESVRDSDEADTLRNGAEIEFAALPNLTYRCWLWAGACCEETFLFYLQGTEVTDVDPKTRKKIACEIGTSLASPVKHSIRGLKKTHAEHRPKGAKEHPKTAARWEWIEIPLPKYATPGRKVLRFMTSQAGFSIGGAVVSSTRKAAPAEAELKDLEKDREAPEGIVLDPDLVAWWTFDDGGGSVAADATGKGHDARLLGPVEWAEGKVGGGMRFTGNGQALRVDDAEDLWLAGDVTLALWMKKEAEAPEWTCLLGKGDRTQRNFGLWLEKDTRQILFQEYGAAGINLKSKKAVPNGEWTHLAATVEGARATLYINGVKEGEEGRKGAAMTGPWPVGIGWANDHSTFRGLLDDVRIYKRALSADEIKALAEPGR
jgi:hypothetical protein